MKSSYTYYTQNTHGDVVNLTDETGAVQSPIFMIRLM